MNRKKYIQAAYNSRNSLDMERLRALITDSLDNLDTANNKGDTERVRKHCAEIRTELAKMNT
jgi:hypothetical protein